MISRTGNRLRLLALAAFGFLAIPSGHAHAQVMRRAAPPVKGQSAKARDSVDSSTLTGKLIMGYQGWFDCPGDGTKVGWWHWFTGADPTVDFLPNAADYPTAEQCVTTMLDAAGNSVNLFSDANLATVETQFAWMRQYGLDGVALQRFSVDLLHKPTRDARNLVLANVRQAAEDNGRVFFVMYDLTGLPNSRLNTVATDWKKLEREGITSSPAYLHHRGHPLLAVWGMGFAGRSLTPSAALHLLKSLDKASAKYGGVTIMGGVPSYWRTGGFDASSDPKWQKVWAKLGVLSPWSVAVFMTMPRQIAIAPTSGRLIGGHARARRGLHAGAVSRLFLRQHQPIPGPAESDPQPDSAPMRPLLLAAGV